MVSTSTEEQLPRLGRYQVLNKLAQGGMAEIFLAKALGVMGFERLVAIKLIHSQLTRDSEFVKMFIDEARIAMHLSHRNIVQVFDLDKTGDTYFIAMEYIHGVNLYDVYERIASKGRWVDLPLALYIVSEACKGLHFAHTRLGPDGRPLGIVHRDISPQNVLLSFEGEVKITDFGIAKAAERLHQTTPGIVKGKYMYMAPEILKEKPVDGRADVFAAGVLLYELLVGENPFAGPTPVATIENVLNKDVPPPSARGAMVSRELDEIALRAIAKDPDVRYRTALELSEALTEHGLNLTALRRDMASGDATVAAMLAELFPEKLKRNTTAQPGGVKLPLLEQRRQDVVSVSLGGDLAATDPSQREQLDSTLLNLDRAPPIDPGNASYRSDEEPSTALDLDASAALGNDKTEGMPAVRFDRRGEPLKVDVDANTAKALPALDDGDTHPPVVVGPSELGPEDGLEATMMHPGDRPRGRGASAMNAPRPIAPQVLPITPQSMPLDEIPKSNDQLVVPVRGPSMFQGGAQGPAPIPPGLLAPPHMMPPQPAAPPPNKTFLMAGVALALAALSVVGALLITRGAGPTLIAMPIQSKPAGAEVTINGLRQANKTPIEAMLPAGKTHRIELRLKDHATYTQDVTPLEGVEGAGIDVKLSPLQGAINFEVEPADARVFVNGADRGSAGGKLGGLDAGRDISIEIKKDGFKPFKQLILLSEGQLETTIKAKLEKL